MILAAGRGERLAPLTDATPKPLIALGGKSLIEHHLLALERAGVDQVTVNVAHLGEQIVDHLHQCSSPGLDIVFLGRLKLPAASIRRSSSSKAIHSLW